MSFVTMYTLAVLTAWSVYAVLIPASQEGHDEVQEVTEEGKQNDWESGTALGEEIEGLWGFSLWRKSLRNSMELYKPMM